MAGEDLQFRESAVESVASPDQVNKVAPIASPRLWLLVAASAVLVAAFVAWAAFGTIPLVVRGTGILIEGTMVVSAESPTDGRIAEVRVRAGDSVEQGEVIALVANPALEAQLKDAQLAAARLREQDAAMSAAEDASIAAVRASLDVREREAQQRESRASAAVAEYAKAVDSKRDLVRQGLLAESELLGSVNAQLELERALSEARNELRRVAAERAESGIRHAQERQRRGNGIADADAAVRQAEARLAAERNVVAPRSGKVLQLLRGTGDVARRGSSVAVISDPGDGRMRCYAFFPLAEGKRIGAGMRALVEPSVADRERYGAVRGSVREVEPVVGSRESLSRIIHSAEVVQDIERRYGGLVSGTVDLEVDAGTATGLRWMGGTGYPRPLAPGTLCDVDVVTEEVAPLSLIVPWFRKVAGG
jgi:HlyD family secretion protein